VLLTTRIKTANVRDLRRDGRIVISEMSQLGGERNIEVAGAHHHGAIGEMNVAAAIQAAIVEGRQRMVVIMVLHSLQLSTMRLIFLSRDVIHEMYQTFN